MDYNEAIKATISKQEAFGEIKKHGLLFEDFVKDCGCKNVYTGKEVLNWLGY